MVDFASVPDFGLPHYSPSFSLTPHRQEGLARSSRQFACLPSALGRPVGELFANSQDRNPRHPESHPRFQALIFRVCKELQVRHPCRPMPVHAHIRFLAVAKNKAILQASRISEPRGLHPVLCGLKSMVVLPLLAMQGFFQESPPQGRLKSYFRTWSPRP